MAENKASAALGLSGTKLVIPSKKAALADASPNKVTLNVCKVSTVALLVTDKNFDSSSGRDSMYWPTVVVMPLTGSV